MDHKGLKITICLILIIIIIIIAILIFMLKRSDGSLIIDKHTDGVDIDFDEKEDSLAKVESKNSYYIIKSIIDNYYLNLSQFNIENDEERLFNLGEESSEEELEAERRTYKEKVYKFLSKSYIEKYDVNIDNIKEKLGSYKNLAVFIDSMRYQDKNELIRTYLVKGHIVEKETLEKEEFIMTVTTDAGNGTFAIYPKYEYDTQEGEIIKDDTSEIVSNKDNKYNFRNIDDSIEVKSIFMTNKFKLKYDIEGAYKSLDEEYRKARFIDYADFEKYVKGKAEEISNISLAKYQVTENENGKRFILVDDYDNYYIINETSTMEYTLILDTYTINIPEFLEKYEKANAQEKVVLNIDRFMKALNDKNYKFAYSILADSFKERNFKTLSDFENYAKANFYEDNKFSYEKFGNEADMYYTYEVRISSEGAENIGKTKTFIVLLKDGTDFELSFNL